MFHLPDISQPLVSARPCLDTSETATKDRKQLAMSEQDLVERVPIELWIAIFRFGLRTWLVPHSDFSLIDSMRFLHTGCASILEFHRVNQIRTNLLLVCKRWNAMISTITARLAVQTDESSKSYPKCARDADRLHMQLDYSCSCEYAHYAVTCVLRKGLLLRQRLNEEQDTSPDELESQVRVLCVNTDFPKWPEGFFESNPPLRALSVPYRLFVGDERLHASSLLSRITHLELYDYGAMIDTVVQVSLPNLLVLDYNVWIRAHDPGVFHRQTPLTSWSIPKLKSLILRQISSAGKIPLAFEEFILSHKTTLTELVIYSRRLDLPFQETNDLLKLVPLLPNLEIFGMDATALLRATPNLPMGPEAERPRTLLLDWSEFKQPNLQVEGRIRKTFEAIFAQKRLFKQIWLSSTWGELRKKLLKDHKSANQYVELPYRIFSSLKSARDLGIVLLDRQGVSLGDDEWRDWTRSAGIIEV
ncbi:hypothetical protein FRC17_008084 [Serendipita sp. 399]|nr:hypothetical protein FRC17_008084 [Serendipita sp. 399]